MATEITVRAAAIHEQNLAQRIVEQHHYLHQKVDARCSVFTYVVQVGSQLGGYLMFGRPEATRCYDGALTYGSVDDMTAGRAQHSRWEVLNLARVWLAQDFQQGGHYYGPGHLPGYVDRKGVWRSTLASAAILAALDRIVVDYLDARPPCFLDEPYQLRQVLSYCDTRLHKGTIYKAAGFTLARTNKAGIETWVKAVRPLTETEDAHIRARALQHPRSQAYRAMRAGAGEQLSLL
jgi:hypothetical protein